MQNFQTNHQCSRQPALAEPKPPHSQKLHHSAKHPKLSSRHFSCPVVLSLFPGLALPTHSQMQKSLNGSSDVLLIWWSTLQRDDNHHPWKIKAFKNFQEPNSLSLSYKRCWSAAGPNPSWSFGPILTGQQKETISSQWSLQYRNSENTERLKNKPLPPKLLAAALRDSSQHLPHSLQQFQDTVPVTWQGAEETHHGAFGTSQRAKSSQKQGLTLHLEITTQSISQFVQ